MSPVASTLPLIRCAAGNIVSVTGSGFGAAPGTLSLLNQGADGTTTTDLTSSISAANWTDSSVSFLVPDGAVSGFVQVTNTTDHTLTAIPLRVVSQYLQAVEFTGQGIPLDDLAPGELDAVLQDASGYADVFMGGSRRRLQTVEMSRYHQVSRRIYPRHRPLLSIDAFQIVISNSQVGTINVQDIVLNADLGYAEILSYAVANYALLGEIQNLGYAANIAKLTYTHGWQYMQTPDALQAATKLIATELLTYRRIQAQGLGGFSSVKQGNQQFQRRSESFDIPAVAKELLLPFVQRRLA